MIAQFKFHSLIILVLAMCISTLTLAQASDPGLKAREQMERLKILEGDYQLVVHTSDDDGETWMAGSAQRVTFRRRHNDLLLEELPNERTEQGFSMTTYITYDQYRNVFRKAAIDDVWGVMDIYQGEIVDNALVLTNLESGTLFPVSADIWWGFRLTLPLTGGAHTMLIEKTDDGGASWQPAFRSVYTPVP